MSVQARQPDSSGGAQDQHIVDGGSGVIEMNPMVASTTTCLVGERCPLVVIQVSGYGGPNASASNGTYHWTLDARVYPFMEVPIELTATPATVPLP